MADLKAVPDGTGQPNQRALTTSFRIPVYWHNMVREEAERLDISLSQVYLRALMQYFGTFEGASWSTDDPEIYDESRFYTHSQDKKGHSVTIHFPLPKPLAGEMVNLANSGMVPAYRSIGDVIRDAVYHRVKRIAAMIDNGELDTAVNMAMLMSDEMKIVDEQQQAEELIDALRSNAQSIYTRDGGNTTRLKRYLAQRREVADTIPAPYRDDYLSAIEDYEKRIERKTPKPTPTPKPKAARRKPAKK